MATVRERAPRIPQATSYWDDALGHGVLYLGDRRIPLKAVDYRHDVIEEIVNRECLRLVTHRLSAPLRHVVRAVANRGHGLPAWMLADSRWSAVLDRAGLAARALS